LGQQGLVTLRRNRPKSNPWALDRKGYYRREFLVFREDDQGPAVEWTFGKWRSRKRREVPVTLRSQLVTRQRRGGVRGHQAIGPWT